MAGHTVTVVHAPGTPTAVVRAATTWDAFPRLWPQLLEEVWGVLRATDGAAPGHNVMLYLDDVPNVEVGVWLRTPCQLTGRVVESSLPAGRVARVTHRGPYQAMADAYQALLDECAAAGERPTRTHWEIYGPHRDDPNELTTEIFWLLEPATPS